MKCLSEAYRYMGIKNPNDISPQIKSKVEELLLELEKLVIFKYTYKIFDIKKDGESIDFGLFKARSRSLSKNLQNSKKAIVFVATLGMDFEKKLSFLSQSEPSSALIFQALGTQALEERIDELEDRVFKAIIGDGFYLKPRFSPGYGDLSLDLQQDIFSVLKPEKYIGAYLSSAGMMLPSKTITAIIGITDKKTDYEKKSCSICEKKDCKFRKTEEGLA